jgi:hypothetical protein
MLPMNALLLALETPMLLALSRMLSLELWCEFSDGEGL